MKCLLEVSGGRHACEIDYNNIVVSIRLTCGQCWAMAVSVRIPLWKGLRRLAVPAHLPSALQREHGI